MATVGEAMQAYGYNSKEMFPSESNEVQEWREGTTFYADFLMAEAYRGRDPKSLTDTWDRAWKAWKNNAKYMVELCLCMNHLCWKNHGKDETLCQWYADKYHFCHDRIFSDGSEDEPLPEGCENFTAKEKEMAFQVLD